MAMKSRITRSMMVLETSVANGDQRRNTRYLAFFAAPPPSPLILCVAPTQRSTCEVGGFLMPVP
jgi:hypothetical protein